MILRPPPRLALSRHYVFLQKRFLASSLTYPQDVTSAPSPASSFVQDLQRRQDELVDEDSLEQTIENHRALNQDLKVGSTLHKIRTSNARPAPSRRSLSRRSLARGANVLPMESGRRKDATVWRPWDKAPSTDRLQALNDDIAAYASWVTLTPSELAVRRVLTAHVKQFLQSQVDGIEIESFGSHEVGLGRPSSDIDVAFYIPSMQKEVGQRGPSAGRPEARAAITKKIRDIETAFEKSNSFQRIRTVVAGRFPLVEAEYGSSGLQFQVVASGAQFQETRISMIQAYCDQWPQFRPLYFTIKAILHSRRLGTPNRGGLGSYPLTIMLLTFFRHRAISRSQDYATTLRGFLLFYNHHNTRHYGLCADPPCTFLKHSADHNPTTVTKKAFEQLPALRDRYNLAMVPDDRSPFLLCLQDPLDSTNDLGARAHRIMDIRETFGTLARQMQDWIEHRGSMGDYYSYLVNPAASNEGLTRRRMSRWRFAEEEAASDIGRLFEAIETPDQMHFGFRVRKTNSRPRFGWAETAIGNTESVDDTAGDDPVDGMSGKDVVDGTCNGRQ